MAKGRNSSTFLSNLVRTTLACFLLRAPHAAREPHQKERTGRAGEGATSPGWSASGKAVTRAPRKETSLLRLSFLCHLAISSSFLSQAPTSCPTPRPRQSPDESWASPRTPRSTPNSPSVLASQAFSSPSSTLQESLPHSLTHPLSHPNPPTSLFKNECWQFYRPGRGEAAGR